MCGYESNNDDACPSSRSKAKEHTLHLERRLKAWSEGKLDDLMHECRTIQQQLSRSQQLQQNNCDRTAKLIAKLMMEGKVRAALRLVTQSNGSGPLPLNNLANPDDLTHKQCVTSYLRNIHPNNQPSSLLTHLQLNPTPYYSMK